MIGKLLRWGNSYGIRLSKDEVERLGLVEGTEIVVTVEGEPNRPVDLSWLRPVVKDGKLREQHDQIDWA